MSVATRDRPLEEVRESVIDQLVLNYGHGHLSLEAFERRLDQAMDSTDHDSLSALIDDLDLQADPAYSQKKQEALGINYQPGDTKETDYIVHIFSGSNRAGAWPVPKEIHMFNIFGGGEIDFSEAIFSHPRVTVNLLCLFGGAALYVPEGVNVTANVWCIFGGFDNKAHSNAHPDAPTINVEGFCIFGGASIEIKRTVREKLMEFADGVKSMFGSTRDKRHKSDSNTRGPGSLYQP